MSVLSCLVLRGHLAVAGTEPRQYHSQITPHSQARAVWSYNSGSDPCRQFKPLVVPISENINSHSHLAASIRATGVARPYFFPIPWDERRWQPVSSLLACFASNWTAYFCLFCLPYSHG